jgi:FkbM family methyltransferase
VIDDPHGWDAFWRVYESGAWEPDTRALVDTLDQGVLFVDVGAWIGPVTLWALDRGAKVIAVEPDHVAAAELRRNVPATVEIWEGAVATHSGHGFLAANPNGGAFGDSMSRLADAGRAVRAWTLPEILDGRVPALVKIDVEGYEAELCPVLMPWLAERGIPVQVSFHGSQADPEWFAGYGNVQWQGPHGDLVAGP